MGDIDSVVELRVHGVSGTPPEQLLNTPLVRQVAGDAKAGFYRPRLPQEQHDTAMPPPGQPARTGPVLEGYAWGGLTSGAPLRALWLALLPFTLINAAPRMRPPGYQGPKHRVNLAVLWFFSRLLALSATVLLVLATAGIGIDLFAWQCAPGPGGPNCANASPGFIMRPLLGLSQEHRLAVGALLPLLVVVLFWQLSGRTINNYENIAGLFAKVAVDSPRMNAADRGPDDIEPALASPWMWRNEYQVRRLRHLHLQCAFACTLWVASAAYDYSWLLMLRSIALAVFAVYVVALLIWPAFMGRVEKVYWLPWVVWAALAAGGGWLLATLLTCDSLSRTHTKGLPDYGATALTVFVVQLVLLAAFAVTIVVMAARTARPPAGLAGPVSLHNWTAIVFATLAVFLGAVFSAGLYIFAAAWLSTGRLRPGFRQVNLETSKFHIPQVIRDAAQAYAVSVYALGVFAVVAVVVVVGWVLVRRYGTWPGRKYSLMLDDAYPPSRGVDWRADKARAGTVASSFWLARQVDYAQRYIAILISSGLLITGWFVYLLIARTRTPIIPGTDIHLSVPLCVDRWHRYPDDGGTVTACSGPTSWHQLHVWIWDGFLSARSLEATGAYFAVMTLILLVGLGALAYRAEKTRKSVGILWDLGSFWPRAAHPFAAPCYAERSVPELCHRIQYYVSGPQSTGVVLAAHSQGTVISAAALLQLGTHDDLVARDDGPSRDAYLRHVAFLSFGCVLRRLYSRYFPAYFPIATLAEVAALLDADPQPDRVDPRWRNLWRYTDYLGGQVAAGPPPWRTAQGPVPGAARFGTAVDVQLVDGAFVRPPGDVIMPAPLRHSNYWYDPAFARTVAVLAETVAVAPHSLPSDTSGSEPSGRAPGAGDT